MPKEDALLQKVRQGPIPRHIAIIMDGNGRWAKKRGLPRIYGHRTGAQTVREIVEVCSDLGVEALTLYAFSTENWSRPKLEISGLMQLLSVMLRKETDNLDKNGVRLRTVGRTEQLPEKVREELARSVKRLEHNRGLVLNLALNYGGRQEIVDAVNRALASGTRKVDERSFEAFLYTDGLPDPDLLIRTSGEQRISNFLLWQTAYSEFYTTKVFWPDFRKKELCDAVLDYQQRERRFGGTQSLTLQKEKASAAV